MNSRSMIAFTAVAVLGGLAAIACADRAPKRFHAEQRSSTAGRAPLPAELDELESLSEEMFDLLLEGRWSRASNLMLSLKETVARAESSQSTEYREIETLLHRLEAATKEHDPYACELSNELTRAVLEATSHFTKAVPKPVALLDYHGRALRLSAGDAVRTRTVKAELQSTWFVARPLVVSAGGSAAAEDFDRLVSAVQRARSTVALARLSVSLLDGVDELENVFVRHTSR